MILVLRNLSMKTCVVALLCTWLILYHTQFLTNVVHKCDSCLRVVDERIFLGFNFIKQKWMMKQMLLQRKLVVMSPWQRTSCFMNVMKVCMPFLFLHEQLCNAFSAFCVIDVPKPDWIPSSTYDLLNESYLNSCLVRYVISTRCDIIYIYIDR